MAITVDRRPNFKVIILKSLKIHASPEYLNIDANFMIEKTVNDVKIM